MCGKRTCRTASPRRSGRWICGRRAAVLIYDFPSGVSGAPAFGWPASAALAARKALQQAHHTTAQEHTAMRGMGSGRVSPAANRKPPNPPRPTAQPRGARCPSRSCTPMPQHKQRTRHAPVRFLLLYLPPAVVLRLLGSHRRTGAAERLPVVQRALPRPSAAPSTSATPRTARARARCAAATARGQRDDVVIAVGFAATYLQARTGGACSAARHTACQRPRCIGFRHQEGPTAAVQQGKRGCTAFTASAAGPRTSTTCVTTRHGPTRPAHARTSSSMSMNCAFLRRWSSISRTARCAERS